MWKNEVIQLTWKSQTGFIYRLSDFQLLRRFAYSGEGWGLATDGRELFIREIGRVYRTLFRFNYDPLDASYLGLGWKRS